MFYTMTLIKHNKVLLKDTFAQNSLEEIRALTLIKQNKIFLHKTFVLNRFNIT